MINFFKRPITKEQSKDTGMAVVLILLIVSLFVETHSLTLVKVAIAALVVDMTYPPIYRPVAVVWLGFSHLLGAVMSRVILSLIFFVIVVPVALVRRMIGKDSLQLKAFKASTNSVMVERNHTFSAKDIETPY